jgi:deazaflavin-dependent oxidoreductase (nitroreductase family)
VEIWKTPANIFRTWGDDAYLVAASKGGTDEPPAWFVNLEHNPQAEVQVKDQRFQVRARVATEIEKPQMRACMVEVWPDWPSSRRRPPGLYRWWCCSASEQTPPGHVAE